MNNTCFNRLFNTEGGGFISACPRQDERIARRITAAGAKSRQFA
jgi:hypothetical protein